MKVIEIPYDKEEDFNIIMYMSPPLVDPNPLRAAHREDGMDPVEAALWNLRSVSRL